MKARSSEASKRPTDQPKRQRRPAGDARLLILQSAEALLVDGGQRAVTVRAVAERVGMTDMGVHHHFGSRERLLEALLEHTAARLRSELAAMASKWLQDGAHLGPLVVGQVELPQHPQRPAEAATSEAARATRTARPSPLVPRRRRAGAVLRLGVHEARRHQGGHRGRAEHPCQ